MIYPANFEDKIKFTRIRELLKENCSGILGAELVDEMKFSTSKDLVEGWLTETNEMRTILTEEGSFPSAYFLDVRKALQRIRVEGLYLEEKELFDFRRSLASVRDMVRFFTSKDQEHYPQLRKRSERITVYPFLFDRIDQILNKYGQLKDNASPELARIRRDIQSLQQSISRKMQSILKQAKAEGLVESDVNVAIRDGRAVIPVPSANKRRLGGIVHDESATGKTTFIEPAEIVEINNQVRELEYAERREIARILLAMSDQIRPYLSDIFYSYEYLGIIDFLMAKAKFALRLNAILPEISNQTEMIWDNAKHPLLLLQHLENPSEVVPLNIELNLDQRILLISGPNAGGKSVCLQTVGLLQYMMQCGMLVPMDSTSRMGFFHQIFIDMGDEQSIENDLSTYSSHLLNMKNFVRQSNNRTMILIDEFGTGTEPMLGGAIAESVLAQLNRQEVYGVITTHYTNLKHFAAQTDGIVNGAMLFDTHAIRPLFKLEMGKPGSSFAFEIARKIGLPESILTEAQEKIGQDHIDFDKHLREIVRDKRYWEQKRQSIRTSEKKLDEVLSRYEEELEKVKKEKKEILRKAKDEATTLLANANRQIENTIREIRENQADKERTKTIRQGFNEFKEEVETLNTEENDRIERKIKQIQDREKRKKEQTPASVSTEAKKPIVAEDNRPLQTGDFVKLEGQQVPGEVVEIKGNNIIVTFGNLRTSVKLNRLSRISKNSYKKESRQHAIPVSSELSERIRAKKLEFKPDIDVRGMRGDEAIQKVMSHVDDAIMCETSTFKILHGKGDGILRKMIREFLATVPLIKTYRDEHVQFGGSGITIVELEV